MSATAGRTAAAAPRDAAFRPNWTARIGWALLGLYTLYAASQLGFVPERLASGLGHGRQFLARMFPPNFSRWELIQSCIS